MDDSTVQIEELRIQVEGLEEILKLTRFLQVMKKLNKIKLKAQDHHMPGRKQESQESP